MNKEVIKAMSQKQNKTEALRKWWSKNGYKVMRVILFPIWLSIECKDALTNYLYSRTAWSEERVTEILNYYIPRRAKWNAEKKEFFFFDNGFGGALSGVKRYVKFKDRRFWNKFNHKYGEDSIRMFLMNKFELDGFTKEVVMDSYDGETEIIFKLKEEKA